jgi:hypothetical protein
MAACIARGLEFGHAADRARACVGCRSGAYDRATIDAILDDH